MEHIISDGMDTDYISKELIHRLEHSDIVLHDESYRQILNYVLVVLKRIKMGKFLQGLDKAETNPIYRKFFEDVVSHYDTSIKLTEGEVHAFQHKLLSVTRQKETYTEIDAQANEQKKISAFVWYICKRLDILEQFGYDNYRVLYSHIVSTIYHLKSNMVNQKNPLYEELEQMYPHIFNCIEEHIHILEEIIGKKMDRNDISYIAMHIASVTESKEDVNEPLHAILVCPTGRCVSLLLKARVLKYFSIVIDDVIPVYKVNRDIHTDFIISTVPLAHCECPVIVVNQMFLQADIEKMQEFIQKIYKLSKEKTTIKKIEEYVHEYQMISGNQNSLEKEIVSLNRRYEAQEKEEDKQYFYRMLKEEHILMDYDAKDWMEAIRVSGDILMKREHLSNHYIDKMIQLIEENGPYIVFEPGFVIAHAGPQDGAHRLGISLVRLKHEIQFEKNGTRVKFIICLSIPDKESHVFLLFQMYKCLINRQIFKFLSEAKSKEEMRSILRIFELDSEDI
ncbi:MAG: PTS sugar transporter subunit IIA, partial [Longicatena sp.]